MPYKEIMWGLKHLGFYPLENLTDELKFDKTFRFGSQGNNFGMKYYIPSDAKLGGL